MSKFIHADPETNIPIIQKLIKNGKISPMIAHHLIKERHSEEYGWLPSQVDEEDLIELDIYSAIQRGRGGSSRELKKFSR